MNVCEQENTTTASFERTQCETQGGTQPSQHQPHQKTTASSHQSSRYPAMSAYKCIRESQEYNVQWIVTMQMLNQGWREVPGSGGVYRVKVSPAVCGHLNTSRHCDPSSKTQMSHHSQSKPQPQNCTSSPILLSQLSSTNKLPNGQTLSTSQNGCNWSGGSNTSHNVYTTFIAVFHKEMRGSLYLKDSKQQTISKPFS